MNKRAIAVLALLAAGLLGYILLFERTSVTSKELSERSGRVLVSFVRDKVDRLELQRKGQRVVLTRKLEPGELGGWQMREPVTAKGDDDAIDQVLGELEWLSSRRTLKDISAEDEQRFGLAAPRYRVAFEVGGARHLLTLGNEDVHGESVYARVDRGSDVYVVPKTILEVLDHPPGHFRDKQLFSDLTVAWVRKLELERAQPPERGTLTKEGDRWWTSAPPRGYADGKRIEALLHALAELRAARHLEPAERAAAEAALAQPAQRIEVTVVPDAAREDKTAKALLFELGGPCGEHAGERYARATVRGAPEALLVCVQDDQLRPLELTASDARDLRLFSAEPSTIERIELARGKDSLTLARSGEQWKLANGAAVDREAVETWLADLVAARATGVREAPAFTERGSLVLALPEGRRERVSLGELGANGELTVKRADEPLVASFPGSLFDRLIPTKKRLLPLEIWSAYQPSQVVRVAARADGRSRALALEAGAWQVASSGTQAGRPASEPSSSALDGERIRELVRALVDLRVRAHVTDQPRPAHGLSDASARVELQVEGERGTLALELGAPTERGALARVSGGPSAGTIVEVGSEVRAIIAELAGGERAELAPPVAPASSETDDEEEEEEHDHAH